LISNHSNLEMVRALSLFDRECLIFRLFLYVSQGQRLSRKVTPIFQYYKPAYVHTTSNIYQNTFSNECLLFH